MQGYSKVLDTCNIIIDRNKIYNKIPARIYVPDICTLILAHAPIINSLKLP